MHECLEVFDIITLIFGTVRDDPSRVASQTLIALAVTCRAFHDVALDILWFKQTSLVPLLKILSHSFWKETPNVGFYRTFTWSAFVFEKLDFTRFDSYAQRIRYLDYAPYAWHKHMPSSPYDLDCLTYLAKRRDHNHCFFPNLRRLRFTVPGFLKQCPRVFLQHSSVSLSLEWNQGDEDVSKALSCIEKYAPELEGLDLGSYIMNRGVARVENCRLLSAFVCKMKNLTRLACGSLALSDKALLHLASLPHLQSLQTPNTVDDIVRSIKAHPPLEHPFLSLRQLSVRGLGDLKSLAKFLACIRPARMKSLKLFFENSSPALDVGEAFIALHETSSHHELRELSFTHEGSVPSLGSSTNRFLIDEWVLGTLFAFTNLTKFELALKAAFALNDLNIKEMAAAWPRLRSLQLGSPSGWGQRSGITLHGILHLLAGCRELEYLGISMDISPASLPPLSMITPQHANKRITYLHVGDSFFTSDGPKTAAVLVKMFPDLNGIGGAWLYSESTFHQPKWELVIEEVRLIRSKGLNRA